jgi:hypothetical protein
MPHAHKHTYSHTYIHTYIHKRSRYFKHTSTLQMPHAHKQNWLTEENFWLHCLHHCSNMVHLHTWRKLLRIQSPTNCTVPDNVAHYLECYCLVSIVLIWILLSHRYVTSGACIVWFWFDSLIWAQVICDSDKWCMYCLVLTHHVRQTSETFNACYIHVCIYVYILHIECMWYTHTCIHIHTHIHTYIHTYIHMS